MRKGQFITFCVSCAFLRQIFFGREYFIHVNQPVAAFWQQQATSIRGK
jgi:hypothetical protein